MKYTSDFFTLDSYALDFFALIMLREENHYARYCFQNRKITSIGIFFRFVQKESVLSPFFLSINKGNYFVLLL